MAGASAAGHDESNMALTYQCASEEVDVELLLHEAATATVQLRADLFPYCLTTTDVSHCQDERCREAALDDCLARSMLEWNYGDGGSQVAGATVTHSYVGAGAFVVNVDVKSGQSTLPGASCDLTLHPTQVIASVAVSYPDAARTFAVGDRFAVNVDIATTVGVGILEGFGFDESDVLSMDSHLFKITSLESAPAEITAIPPGARIWSGRFTVEAMAQGVGHIGVPMHYRVNGQAEAGHVRKRIVVGVDLGSRILPIFQHLLEIH
jgi:hypothetical protein